MLRHKTEIRPGLVALYDIRPGNRAGQFLQPRSPHGAIPVECTGTDFNDTCKKILSCCLKVAIIWNRWGICHPRFYHRNRLSLCEAMRQPCSSVTVVYCIQADEGIIQPTNAHMIWSRTEVDMVTHVPEGRGGEFLWLQPCHRLLHE